MNTKDIFRHGGAGFIMGFYGTGASRAMGVKIESDPVHATQFWGATLVGAVDTLLSGGREVSKFLPFILGLVIGTVSAAIVFDNLHPNYQSPRLGK